MIIPPPPSLSAIANTALNEAAHVLGYEHPNPPTWVGPQSVFMN
jgi:hypothetical protein